MKQTPETVDARKRRARRILKHLHTLYPEADCALKHRNAWQLLIATILSAQSTDENVNRVTRELFRKYKKPADFLAVPVEELQNDIRSSGFFRQKTRSIRGTCRLLVDEFKGRVPQTMNELLRLPGVARKTANVVLGTWFGKNVGVVVDTHVGRLSERLALTWTARNSKDAARIERDLMEVVPRTEWTYLSHALIWHGRKVCTARRPDCDGCALVRLCPAAHSVVRPSGKRKKKRMLREPS